ncbi:hypothetical protein [Butyrivibrio sp. AE3004]|uniref:hypothetical protein n=1 Tax=Butyrivibrio sp. AE3004 TaxID=1506994 RepID=UPI0004943B09|nr:hypothetical protein [Butyrivibrio sp. AE3004]
MKKIFALMLAGAIFVGTPGLVNAETQLIKSPDSKSYEEGYNEGKNEGYNQGKSEGYNEGKSEGYNEGKSEGYNQGKSEGYNQGKSDGASQGKSEGYSQGKFDGYNQGRNDGYAQGKDYGEVKGKVEVYESTVIPQMNQRVTDLQNQVNRLYDKIIELSQKETKVQITVKTSGGSNNKKPKVVVKTLGSSSGNNSPSEPPFLHTVLNAPGLNCTTPVGQGGKLVICGKPTRATFTMRETTSGKVSSAQVLAAGIGGKVKNVVETYAPGVRFSKAQVDFKVYGCQNGDIYKVYQMGGNGTWQEVQVDEVREGHVICTVYKTGTFAFIKMN